MASKQSHWKFQDIAERDALTPTIGVQDGDLATIKATGELQQRVAGNWENTTGTPQLAGLPLDGLVCRVDFGDVSSYPGSGSIVKDLEGGLQNGALTGTYRAGAAYLTGSGNKIQHPKNSAMDNIFSGGGTIMALILPHSEGQLGFGYIMATADATEQSGWGLHVKDAVNAPTVNSPRSMNLAFFRDFGAGANSPSRWKTQDLKAGELRPIQVGRWHSVAVAYDDSSDANVPDLYVDGVKQGIVTENSTTGVAVPDTGVDLFVGNRTDLQRTWDGLIAVYLAWSRVLDEQEIAKVHGLLLGRGVSALVGSPGISIGGADIRPGDAILRGGDFFGTSFYGAGAARVRGGDSQNGSAGGVFIEGGNAPNGYAGNVIVRGGRGDLDLGSEFGGATITGSGGGVATTFRGTDNEGSGAAGDTILRAGDCPDGTGSGIDPGGDLGLRSGLPRSAGSPGQVVIRSAGPPSSQTAGSTGDLTITTQATNDPAGLFGSFGGSFTSTGNITITTNPGGSQASGGGNVTIRAGDKGGTGAGNPGNVTIEAGSNTSGNTVAAGSVSIRGGSPDGVVTFASHGAADPVEVQTHEIQTTNATAVTRNLLSLPASGNFVDLEVNVSAIRAGGAPPNVYSRKIVTMFYNDGGSISEIAPRHLDQAFTSGDAAMWSANVVMSGTDILLQVQGDTNATAIEWSAMVILKPRKP